MRPARSSARVRRAPRRAGGGAPVARDRAADPAADGVRDARRLRPAARPRAVLTSRHLDAGAGPRASAAKRRPLTNRARSGRKAGAALGPATSDHRSAGLRLRIRRRKPCFFFRLRLFGWYVRLHAWPPRTPGPKVGPWGGRAACCGTAHKWKASLRAGARTAAIHPSDGPSSRTIGASSRERPVIDALVGVVHSADMRAAPRRTGRPRCSGTSPWPRRRLERWPIRPGQEQPDLTRPWLLHTCGHTLWTTRGVGMGTPAADDLWAKVAAAVRAQLSEATWNTWFQGVHALDLHRRDPDARGPELGRRRAHPHQLPRAAHRRGPGPHRRPARRSSCSSTPTPAPTPRRSSLDQLTAARRPTSTDETGAAPPSPTPAPAVARPPQLNPRYTFDQFVIGASNRFAHAAALSRRREPGPVVQPAVHLRPRRAREDPPPARDRPPRPRALLQQARSLRVDRDDDERVRRRDALEGACPASSAATARSTCSSSTTSSSSSAPSSSRRSSSTRSTTCTAAAARS